MRNPNGYGTVYELPGNRRRPWVARITVGWKWNDEKQRHVQDYQILGYFEERPQAMVALANHHVSPVPLKADITMEEVYKEWSAVKFAYIEKQTEYSYQAGWKHLDKYAKVKFKELRAGHIQSVIDACHKKGMSRSSLEKIKVVATMLCDYAMQNDIVNKNYADFVRLPKSDKEEKSTFTDLEIQKIEKSGLPWADTILILIYTGLRINELLGLTRFGVDLDKQLLTGGLKTDAGKNRIIPIHAKILPHIAKWHNKKGDYLICSDDGGRIRDKLYREKCYYPVLEKLEVSRLTPHCCRHTFASLMRRAGADTKAIQILMGHAKYSFTAQTYTHTDAEELKAAIAKI